MIFNHKKRNIGIQGLSLKKSDSGLTNVITVVLIIAIVMALIIGPYLTIMVPEQTRHNESDHLDEVKESFITLRGAINTQLTEDISTKNTRVKLGTDDENLFVLGGSGVLYFDSTEPLVSISSYYDSQSIFARGSGNIRYRSQNLYYTDRSLIYETTGVIVSQGGKSTMTLHPDFDLDRRRVEKNLGLDVGFAWLAAGNSVLRNVYLINTGDTDEIITKARISWNGGNASVLNLLNIDGGTVEWSGSSASGIIFNFQSDYTLPKDSVEMRLRFDDDVQDTTINIELFTNSTKTISARWPVTTLDSMSHTYDLSYPDSQTVNNIKFKNICDRTITIERMALSWTGSATLWRVELPGHGNIVWDVTAPGRASPVYFPLDVDSIFAAGEEGAVNLYFTGNIQSQNINIKFFAENSTNDAIATYPINLNETYINASFSIVTLICDNINIGGKSSVMVESNLISSEDNRYIWQTGESIILNITTSYPDAWIEYFNSSLVTEANLIWDYDGIGAFDGDYYFTTNKITDDLTNINFVLNSIYRLDCIIGVVQVELG